MEVQEGGRILCLVKDSELLKYWAEGRDLGELELKYEVGEGAWVKIDPVLNEKGWAGGNWLCGEESCFIRASAGNGKVKLLADRVVMGSGEQVAVIACGPGEGGLFVRVRVQK